jgi:hypothetical protein
MKKCTGKCNKIKKKKIKYTLRKMLLFFCTVFSMVTLVMNGPKILYIFFCLMILFWCTQSITNVEIFESVLITKCVPYMSLLYP